MQLLQIFLKYSLNNVKSMLKYIYGKEKEEKTSAKNPK